MKEEIKRLIQDGLYQDNLLKLVDLCNQNLEEYPCLYFILKEIFKSLENEYDDQAVSEERYNRVMTLAPVILSALEDPSRENINKLIRAFNELTN